MKRQKKNNFRKKVPFALKTKVVEAILEFAKKWTKNKTPFQEVRYWNLLWNVGLLSYKARFLIFSMQQMQGCPQVLK